MEFKRKDITIMGNIVSLLQNSKPSYDPISDWVAEQLIIAYSDGDDVLEIQLEPENRLALEFDIAHDLTKLNWIKKGIVL